MSDNSASLALRVESSRYVVVGSFAVLWGLLLVQNVWAVLPLLLFVWGVWKSHWRSHIWLCFVLLFYFLVSINQLASNQTVLGYLVLMTIVVLFTAAMLWCRWSKQYEHDREQAGEQLANGERS